MRKGSVVGIILLLVGTGCLGMIPSVPLCNAGTFHDPGG